MTRSFVLMYLTFSLHAYGGRKRTAKGGDEGSAWCASAWRRNQCQKG